jgi:histidyl-tRNA synthetase
MKIRGTNDFFNEKERLFTLLVEVSLKKFSSFGYNRIRFPLISNTALFERTIESSDIVNKELFSFKDRGDRDISLIPEGTAPAARLISENRLFPNKFFYITPCFRYDRPQKGRYRQFHQIGAEIVGYDSIYSDIELIILLDQIMRSLGIQGKLIVNYLGNEDVKESYRDYLREKLSNRSICKECEKRVKQNIIRVLDCKSCNYKDIKSIELFLDNNSKERYEKTLDYLTKKGLTVFKNNIVRGLDYYTGFVFEYEYNDIILAAGGRYDNLYRDISNIDLPAVGFGIGIERTMESINADFDSNLGERIEIIPVEAKSLDKVFSLANYLRSLNIPVDFDFKFKKLSKKLAKVTNRFVLIVGDKEIESGLFKLKDMILGKEEEILLKDIVERFKNV